jgi:glycosyltransferase involved in cell wall biosynthesis
MIPVATTSAAPRIGVLINNYNNGPWLRACVDSALAQSRPPDEVIVYDDGSTDDSLAILRAYGDRIRLIEGVHVDARHAFASQFAGIRAAFAASAADHLHLLDGDDLFLPGKIERYEAAWADRPDLVLIQAPMLRIGPDGAALREEREARKQVADALAATYAAHDPDFHYWTSALAFRREPLARLLDLCEPITPALAADSSLAGIAPLLGPVATLEPALTAWRRHPRSLSRRQTATRLNNLRARQSHFNRVAALLGARPLRPWRSRGLYLELARTAGLTRLVRLFRPVPPAHAIPPPPPLGRPARVGVLINNYNTGPWLRACVDSVLAQTRPPDEIIVCDDGSTDDSVAILRSYGDRIRLLEGVHDPVRSGRASQAAAIHRAFAASTADHLHLLDGDDLYLPDRIRRYEEAWAGRPAAILIQAPMRRIDADGHPLFEEREARKHVADHLAATYAGQDPDLHYWTSALAFRRDFLAARLPLDYSCGLGLAVDSALAGVAPLYGPVVTLETTLTAWRRLPKSQNLRERASPLKNLRLRQANFNRAARALGAAPLHPLRCPAFYKEVLRALGVGRLVRFARRDPAPSPP